MVSLRRLSPYLRPHLIRLAAVGAAAAAVAGLNGATIWALKTAINAVFDRRDPELLLVAAALIPAFFLLKTMLAFAQTYGMSLVGLRVTRRLREDVFRRLHELPMDFFWKNRSADTLSRISHDLTLLGACLQSTPAALARDVLTAAVVAGFLFAVHWRLALVAALAVPLAAAAFVVLGRELRAASEKSQRLMSAIHQRFQESLQGMLLIKTSGHESAAIGKFGDESAAFFDQMRATLRASALSGPLMELLGGLVVAALVYGGGREILEGRLTPADFFIVLGGFFALHGPIKGISQMNASIQSAAAAAERVFALLDEQSAVRDRPSPIVFRGLRRGIELENVSFRYPGRRQWALRGVSLRIAPGEVVALVGPNGSGKSTLAHLLLRLFDPQEGRVLLDGRDLRDYSLSSLRPHLGVVTQDTVIFNDTLAENVAVGNPGAGDAAVEAALDAAGARAFVDNLPLKSRTPVGERGLRLSGGQRQLVAIARVALKNPAILLLDEAASSLDAASERAAHEALTRLYPGRTVLVTAHDLAAAGGADRVVAMRDGRVISAPAEAGAGQA